MIFCLTLDRHPHSANIGPPPNFQHKTPLPPASALDDVSADHAQKTVTIEPFPHSSLSMASVHPCKHSSVMKKVIERMDKGVVEAQRKEREREKKEGSSTKGKWKKLLGGKDKDKDKERRDGGEEEEEGPEGLRVDQYLVVFLKFISTIGSLFLPPLLFIWAGLRADERSFVTFQCQPSKSTPPIRS